MTCTRRVIVGTGEDGLATAGVTLGYREWLTAMTRCIPLRGVNWGYPVYRFLDQRQFCGSGRYRAAPFLPDRLGSSLTYAYGGECRTNKKARHF
jgi:hypothetical protein